MKKSFFTSHSPKETKDFAKNLARQILFNPPQKKGALIIGLEGELGAGKTTFVQGFAKGLGVKEKVLSPTFVILKKFTLSYDRDFYHVDCYRLKGPKELLALGWKEISSNAQNIVVVEWAERVKKILPEGMIYISFRTTKEQERRIIVA